MGLLLTKMPHPIPYQGSKRKLAPTIGKYIPRGVKTFFEPFAGSAAMTIYAAYHRRAEKYVVGDSLRSMALLLREIVKEPERTAAQYREIWNGQNAGDRNYFYEIRNRYNAEKCPIDLLYLICRCVKNSVRFNAHGRFTQSVDKRRLGMHPDKMESAIVGVSSILHSCTEFRVGDWQDTIVDAYPDDFVYLDPPYLGTSIGRDKRYHQQLMREDLISGLAELRQREVPFALSYDGMTGGKEYGPPLPETLGLTRLMLHAGISSQSTLSGRNEETIESLYVTPGLAEPVDGASGCTEEQISLGL